MSLWYIVKQPEGHCVITSESELENSKPSESAEHWGPFDSEGEAIARRVGLIRSGKCKPV
jgi:hypothetical protein